MVHAVVAEPQWIKCSTFYTSFWTSKFSCNNNSAGNSLPFPALCHKQCFSILLCFVDLFPLLQYFFDYFVKITPPICFYGRIKHKMETVLPCAQSTLISFALDDRFRACFCGRPSWRSLCKNVNSVQNRRCSCERWQTNRRRWLKKIFYPSSLRYWRTAPAECTYYTSLMSLCLVDGY